MKTLLSFAIILMLAIPVSAQSVTDLITVYRADYGALSRKYDVKASEQYYQRFDEFYREWLSLLDGISFDGNMSQAEKVDFTLLKNAIQESHYFLAKEKENFNNLKPYLPAPDSIMDFISLRRVGTNF